MSIKHTTYTKITAKIITLILLFTLFVSFIYGEYIKQNAIEKFAQIDSRKTSKIVFESYYAAMSKGWNKQDLKTITKRLNDIDESLSINIYRAPTVSKLYGKIEEDEKIIAQNSFVANALEGKEVIELNEKDSIEYFYPLDAKNECLKCHTNVSIGDTLGVIHIKYPTDEIKVSLNSIINFFMIFITIFSFVMFVTLFINFQKYLLSPIRNFIKTLDTIKNSKDIKKRASGDNYIEEIQSMQNVFNSMLDSIEQQFYNDNLTGVYNRISLIEALDMKREYLLMIIDIDQFQEINDLYGDKIGDEILIAFSKYITEVLPNNPKIYRLHADEFAYLNAGEMDIKEFEELAAFLIDSVTKHRFSVSTGQEVQIRITIGISFGLELLLPHADIALKIAKKGKKHQLTYDDSMREKQHYEMNISWTKKLNKAIEEERILALFQPIVECYSDEIVKYECLMRIKDDYGQYISPDNFLELSKKNKVYQQLTKAVLKDTFRTFRDSKYKFSVNLSVEDIFDDEITSYIQKEISNSDIGKRMVIEIIESEGIENYELVSKFIKMVKDYGVELSIDDFGTGYSNFEYLIQLNVDYIKIDGSLIKNLDSDENSKMVVQTIVEFAKRMGIKSVAEFVYSKEIYEIVKELGVDLAQGYYFGQPSRKIN